MLERERERNGKYVIEGSVSAGSYHEDGMTQTDKG